MRGKENERRRGGNWRAEERRGLEVIGENCRWELQERMTEKTKSEAL